MHINLCNRAYHGFFTHSSHNFKIIIILLAKKYSLKTLCMHNMFLEISVYCLIQLRTTQIQSQCWVKSSTISIFKYIIHYDSNDLLMEVVQKHPVELLQPQISHTFMLVKTNILYLACYNTFKKPPKAFNFIIIIVSHF